MDQDLSQGRSPSGEDLAAPPPPDRGREEPAPLAGLTYFTLDHARILAAAAARLIPSDETGPGAAEAGVVCFIDRQLGTGVGYRGRRYGLGPFLPGESTQGDQSALDLRDRFRLGLETMDRYARGLYGDGFAALASEQQDRILGDMEAGARGTSDEAAIQLFPPELPDPNEADMGAKAFFELLRAYTIAGFFADPLYGGNRDMVGWKLIGFPGVPVTGYTDHILKYGEPFAGEYRSLAVHQERVGGGAQP